jgi:RNA polymerase sigma-70 factor, ECF subfamily
VFDGEDIVQDTLARAYYELSGLKQLPALRAWLFRIAHNRALDYLRSYDQRMREPLEALEPTADPADDPEDALIRSEATRATLARFVDLPPAQRSCVIVKDVLEYSLEEVAGMLELTVPAVKAALHRGRTRLRAGTGSDASGPPRALAPLIARYADLFNARDWEAVRSLLVDDVKLDVVSQLKRSGRHDVDLYFSNYDRWIGWRMTPGWVDGREALVIACEPPATRGSYFVEVTVATGGVAAIRDYYHVRYIAVDATIEFEHLASMAPRDE